MSSTYGFIVLEMEIRKLKRALWLARAERAKSEATRWKARVNNSVLIFLDQPIFDIWKKWLRVERLCREKAEEYR